MMNVRKTLSLSVAILTLVLLSVALPVQMPGSTGIGRVDPAQPEIGMIGAAIAAPEMETLFVEDFEDGLGSWNTDSNWSIVYEGMNPVMQGVDHALSLIHI